jgi:AmmeMemoRadiSam system protein B
MSSVRPPAVAGAFYQRDPSALRDAVDRLLGEVPRDDGADVPRALIAPHAGYVYSGPIAASAFCRVAGAGFTRVVVVGPSHFVPFRGIAAPRVLAFATPLGEVPLDREALTDLPGVHRADEPHQREHAIEVELPFLQRVLPGGFALVPLVVGDATEAEVAEALAPFADDPATLIVVSSDLSHFLDYETARRRDLATAEAIERLEGAAIGSYDACGWLPIQGWLALARRHGLRARRLDLRNSGDTAGDRASVVGYGAWAFQRNDAQFAGGKGQDHQRPPRPTNADSV